MHWLQRMMIRMTFFKLKMIAEMLCLCLVRLCVCGCQGCFYHLVRYQIPIRLSLKSGDDDVYGLAIRKCLLISVSLVCLIYIGCAAV